MTAAGKRVQLWIRRRHQVLREMVGKVADQRRAVEPVFTEVRDRQNQLERALLDLETDDRKNNLADRLKDIGRDVSALLGRVGAVQATYATLDQYKDDLAKSHAELAPALSKSKREVEDRLAGIFDNFNALDALRKDIGGIFSTIRNSLNRIG